MEFSTVRIVEWDSIVRDGLMLLSILGFILNLCLLTLGGLRLRRTGTARPFAAAMLVHSLMLLLVVLFFISWRLSDAYLAVAAAGPSIAHAVMLNATTGAYLKSFALSLPAIAIGVSGAIALHTGAKTNRN